MRRVFAVLIGIFALAAVHSAQERPEPRIIEVSGSAEKLITPDEFTFKITLFERMENKQKVTIEQQEAALRNELSRIGVDVAKDLSIFDISSSYFRQKKIKDVLGTKDYRLKLRDLDKIARLQEVADRLNIHRLELIDTEHSEISRLRRETKIDALRAAKEKADYLLSSIGQKAGNAVFIKEIEAEQERPSIYSNYSTANVISNVRRPSQDGDDDTLSFTQIKLRFVITAKFEIQ